MKLQTYAIAGPHPNHQLPHRKESGPKKLSGSQALDPITIQDDEEPDAAEVNCIDLEDDKKIRTKGSYTSPIKQGMVGASRLGIQSLAESQTPNKDPKGSEPARYTGSVTQPLFRALTQDDLQAPSAQPLLETQAVGFKAWHRSHGSHETGKVAPIMQQKGVRQNASIKLSNKERIQRTGRAGRDAPQFTMSTLPSRRKRTIGEVGYNELISPAQIESPSEKLARVAKRRRQRQERCNMWPQDVNAKDAQSAPALDHVHDHEKNRTTGENVNLPGLPTMTEALDGQETIARLSDDRSGPSVNCEPTSVSTYTLTRGLMDNIMKESCREQSNDHVETHTFCSIQTTAQDPDGQEHGDGNNIVSSNGGECKSRKSRASGPTNVCGVFSPEKKPPVKRSSHGEFHCPRCDSQFTRSKGVNYHFEGCIAKYGNPRSLRWNDHPSLAEVENGTISINKSGQESFTSSMHDIKPVDRPATAVSKFAPPRVAKFPASPGPLSLPESRTLIEEQALHPGNDAKPDHQPSTVGHRVTGDKGLSAETLKIFQETGGWKCGIDLNENIAEIQDKETDVPLIAYQYFVVKREWLETEEDALESSIGPYYTLKEANAVAKVEVQYPQIDAFEGIQSKGWSYYYGQDEHGMETHLATVLGINIEAVVHRGKWLFAWQCSLAKAADSERFQRLRQLMNGFRSPCPPFRLLSASMLSMNCNGYLPLTLARVQLHCTANPSHTGLLPY